MKRESDRSRDTRRAAARAAIIVALLAASLCAPGDAATLPPSAISPTQSRFLQAYGSPTVFVLLFMGARRIETWVYVPQGLRILFDNGFFVKESRFDPRAFVTVLPPTSLRPSDFAASMTRDQLRAKYGTPDAVTSAGRRFAIDRYLAPGGVKAFAFRDTRLVGVTAGFAIAPALQMAAPPQSPIGPSASHDVLGIRWNEQESGYSAIWTRRGSSNLFDGTWVFPGYAGQVTAVLAITITGRDVAIRRGPGSDGFTCEYRGTLAPDGITVTGTYRCVKGTTDEGWRPWQATITR